MFNILQFDIEEFLKQNKKTIMAIEGRAASGKTTLANFLGKKYNATIFHIDDFFLPIKLQTPKRLSKAGENIDHERFLYEILLPIKNGETQVLLKKFNCQKQDFEPSLIVKLSNLIIVEGVYCLNKNLSNYYDYKVFLDIDYITQHKRLKERSTLEIYNKFINKWLPLEEEYFKDDIINQCDIIIPSNKIII